MEETDWARSSTPNHVSNVTGKGGPGEAARSKTMSIAYYTIRPRDMPAFWARSSRSRGGSRTGRCPRIPGDVRPRSSRFARDFSSQLESGQAAAEWRARAEPSRRRSTSRRRKTPALFGAGLIDNIPDRDIIANERAQRLKWGLAASTDKTAPVGRVLRMADGRIGRFGWKAQTVSLKEFVRAACANELGLGNPGQAQPQPMSQPNYITSSGFDLTLAQCDQLAEFINSLPRPVERTPQDLDYRLQAKAGKSIFHSIGCADCHTPDVGQVRGLYSDLLLHEMGQELEGEATTTIGPSKNRPSSPGTGPLPAEWRTPPALWGVCPVGCRICTTARAAAAARKPSACTEARDAIAPIAMPVCLNTNSTNFSPF